MTVKRVAAVLMWTVYPLTGGVMGDKLKTPGSVSCAEKKLEGRPGGERTRTRLLVHLSDIGDFRSSLVVNETVSNNKRSCIVCVVVRVRLVSRRRSSS